MAPPRILNVCPGCAPPKSPAQSKAILVCKDCQLRVHAECANLPANYGQWQCKKCRLYALDDEASQDQARSGTIEDERVNDDTDLLYLVNNGTATFWVKADQVSPAMKDVWESEMHFQSLSGQLQQFNIDTAADMLEYDSESTKPIFDHHHGKYLRQGYWAFAAHTYPEAAKHSALKGISDLAWQDSVSEVLAMTPSNIIEALCGPGLRYSRVRDGDLRQILETYRREAVNRPCQYVLELVNALGETPLVGEMRAVIEAVRSYLRFEDADDEAIDFAVRVDQCMGTLLSNHEKDAIRNGERKYVSGTDENQQDKMRPKVEKLLDAIERALDGLADHERMPFVLTDVGYTDNGVARIDKQHKRHQSSNDIMNIIEAVAITVLDGKYRIQGDVVFLCAHRDHGAIGEIVFSFLANSYSKDGRGFNGVDAGVQLNSLRKALYVDESYWNPHIQSAMDTGPMKANIAAENERLNKHFAEVASLRSANKDMIAQVNANLRTLRQKIIGNAQSREHLERLREQSSQTAGSQD